MMAVLRFAVMSVAAIGSAFAADAPPLTLSHGWIVVRTGAPEGTVLEKAGFRIAPTINRHDGQGTASVTVELLNGFLELIYPDPTVPVSPALRAGAEKFRLKSAWRETGYSPIGIVFDRTPATPKEVPKAVSLSISSHPASTRERENAALARDPVKGAMFLYPNGARRLTGLRVVAPSADRFPPAATYMAGHGLVKFCDARQRLAGCHQGPPAGSTDGYSLLKRDGEGVPQNNRLQAGRWAGL